MLENLDNATLTDCSDVDHFPGPLYHCHCRGHMFIKQLFSPFTGPLAHTDSNNTRLCANKHAGCMMSFSLIYSEMKYLISHSSVPPGIFSSGHFVYYFLSINCSEHPKLVRNSHSDCIVIEVSCSTSATPSDLLLTKGPIFLEK